MRKPRILSALIFGCLAYACLAPAPDAAQQPTPDVQARMKALSAKMDRAQQEVQRCKDAWDRARLKTTLYDQRYKRDYRRWIKSKRSERQAAGERKDRADLEFRISVEKRKLAYDGWLSAVRRLQALEYEVKALDAEKDSQAVRDRIQKLEDKLRAPSKPSGKG